MPAPTMAISVIDDDKSVRRALRRLLKSFGYDVKVYASARDFLDHGMSTQSIIILDVQMPDMDGFELCKVLSDAGVNSPVVFMTAHESREVREKALLGGAVAFLHKPFDDQALLNAIQLGISREHPHGQSSPR